VPVETPASNLDAAFIAIEGAVPLSLRNTFVLIITARQPSLRLSTSRPFPDFQLRIASTGGQQMAFEDRL
jgi:hypothetical protein